MNKEHQKEEQTSVLDAILERISLSDQRKTEDRMLLAAKIDDLIKGRGLTKTGFASLVGQRPSVISKWLSGTHNFTQDTLTEISLALDVPLMELFKKKEPELFFKAEFSVGSGVFMSHSHLRPLGGLLEPALGITHYWHDPNSPALAVTGILSVPQHIIPDWVVLSSMSWAGNNAVYYPKKKDPTLERHSHTAEEDNYAIKV